MHQEWDQRLRRTTRKGEIEREYSIYFNMRLIKRILSFFVRPPLRQYLLDGEFFVGAAIACTLTKMALRYIGMEQDQGKQNVREVE